MLTAPHITLPCCITLTPLLFSSSLPTNFLLTVRLPPDPSWLSVETPLGNADFSWFTDGSYLKSDNDKYHVPYEISTLFPTIDMAPFPLATIAQQAELYVVTWSCNRGNGKTIGIYTDSKYAFTVDHDFGMLWKQCGFLTSKGNKIKNGKCVPELLDAILLSDHNRFPNVYFPFNVGHNTKGSSFFVTEVLPSVT